MAVGAVAGADGLAGWVLLESFIFIWGWMGLGVMLRDEFAIPAHQSDARIATTEDAVQPEVRHTEFPSGLLLGQLRFRIDVLY